MRRIAPTRRALIGGTAGLAAGALGARRALAVASVPEAATLLAPGPEDGAAAGFAARAAQGLARGLVQAAALRVTVVGGPDGITAANRFAAATAPDGRALLVLPGQATHALLVGDSRARFEPRHWPALAVSLGPAILAGRGALAGAAPLRLALPGPGAPEAAALLALDLAGRPAQPATLPAGMPPEAAVQHGLADALVLSGAGVLPRAAALGLTPWFAFDAPGLPRDADLAGLPGLGELVPDPPQPHLLHALRAAGAALRCRAVLVLPALTSADQVAIWRGAAQRWTEAEPEAQETGTRRAGPGEAAATLGTLCPASDAALAYREWLLRRLGWQAA